MTDREEAGLRGSVRICVEETTYPTGKSLTTTEYGPDGRLLTTRTSNSDGSECFTTKTYEADGRLVKTSSAKSGEPATETLYAYDEAGRLKESRDADGEGNLTGYRYDQQGRNSEIKTFAPEVIERYRNGVLVAGKSFDLGLAALLVISVAGQVAFSIRVSTLLEPARFIVRIEGFSGRFARLGRGSLDQAAISFVCLRGEAF